MRYFKTRIVFMITLMIPVFVLTGCTQKEQRTTAEDVVVPTERIDLWNGKDFHNWSFYLEDQSVDPGDVWEIRDGVIYCTGQPNGYMKTDQKYANYRLHVEWRWPEEPGNSGVFLHMREPDNIWPKSIECQLMSGNAGDFVAFADVDFTERVDMSSRVVEKLAESSENPVGEWNEYDIYCREDSVRVVVNGVLQNIATNTTIRQGRICLQSEGAPIEFRNVYLEPLNAE